MTRAVLALLSKRTRVPARAQDQVERGKSNSIQIILPTRWRSTPQRVASSATSARPQTAADVRCARTNRPLVVVGYFDPQHLAPEGDRDLDPLRIAVLHAVRHELADQERGVLEAVPWYPDCGRRERGASKC
jgi:hypothetical protein